MKGNIKDYLEQTNTVLLTKDAFEYLKEKACAIDKARVEICQLHSYVAKFAGGSFAIHIDKEKVLQIIDKYQAESEPQESEDDTWSLKDATDALKRHGFLQEQESCDDAISRILKRMWNCRGKNTTSIDKVKMEQIIRDELPSVTPQQKMGRWIPVSERLPEPFEFVNCTCHSLIDDREDWVVETVYLPQPHNSPYSDWGNIPMLNWGECEVIAWMYRDIPEPYKAESEEQNE